ncbi:MAG: hypothetical protein M1829_000014 [Trizodia sp. TS-e1964]|nr:MAG: hypothetical protein M1829_000014 [Trizodia sp. TS-e1964]
MLSSIFSGLADSLLGRQVGATKKMNPFVEMLLHNWYLGFTAFGGPAVHFQIFHRLFVEKLQWLDIQMYQELFALCQALSGPGSTKMIYCINVIRCGFLPGLLSFFVWRQAIIFKYIPSAIAAYGLSLGIARIDTTLPAPVYALLSGLNAATVGIIALAAVQLSTKAITDRLTRILVFLGATAGMLYNALWYFPVLMVAAGLATAVWDLRWPHYIWRKIRPNKTVDDAETGHQEPTELKSPDAPVPGPISHEDSADTITPAALSSASSSTRPLSPIAEPTSTPAASQPAPSTRLFLSWKLGTAILLSFLAFFTTIMILRGVLQSPPRAFQIFANLFLAGTIIFGGGPVVIPLLREYVVVEGWVTPRDFLLGLALIQAFPGPNFNFAVYLGALAGVSAPTPLNAALGALIGYAAIFSPGLILHTGAMGVWSRLRKHGVLASALRGVNAAAVGLVYTAVYRLWEIGFLDEADQTGSSLGRDPWWVVVTATSFVGGMWFQLAAPLAILLGGVMGLVWWGVVR